LLEVVFYLTTTLIAMNKLRIGTRRSALAIWQAEWVASKLAGVDVELVYITTQGDAQSGPLAKIGGSGVFTKEIERALLERQIDLAIHSLKDLPTEIVAGLAIAAVPPRESVHDVLIARGSSSIDTLPPSATVGTGSMRRRAQLLAVRPDVNITDIRGNIDTRLRKLDDGLYDAIILAEAGLKRLGLHDRITQVIPANQMLPAIGQGALALETRADDAATIQLVSLLDDSESHLAVRAERALLAGLRAGCLAPVAAWARCTPGIVLIDAVVLDTQGKHRLFVHMEGSLSNPEELGQRAARDLVARGADRLIQTARTA
jgi:hydroxymethylbilane synthase